MSDGSVARAPSVSDRLAGLELGAPLPAVWAAHVRRAVEFARLAGAPTGLWMLWAGWCAHVGCDECADQGPAAACWGHQACHGWSDGCGCIACATRQARAIADAESGADRPRLVLVRSIEGGRR